MADATYDKSSVSQSVVLNCNARSACSKEAIFATILHDAAESESDSPSPATRLGKVHHV